MTERAVQQNVLPAAEGRRIDGIGKEALEMGRNRLLVTAAVLSLAFLAIGGRLIDLAVLTGAEPVVAVQPSAPPPLVSRADITDRNGVVLASSLPTASMYADPSEVIDVNGAVRALTGLFDDLDADKLRRNLNRGGRFLWIKRNLSPEQQMAANRLGLPGFAFLRDERRVYPHGMLTAHVLGATDIDGNGISGVERQFDARLRRDDNPLKLSVDVRVQSILRTELAAAMSEFNAIGAAGVVLDIHTGELLAMASLPDFDPNDRRSYVGDARFNRVTKGVYEMGSTFKLFTAAMALDSGTVNMASGYDATDPIRISRFTISDFHPEKRWLSVPEIIVHSSNIGAAKMAVDVGTDGQKSYLRQLGLLDAAAVELPEVGRPLVPQTWRDINTMTISYGHGIAVTPVQLVSAIATLVNGGVRRPATLLRHTPGTEAAGEQVLSPATSEKMRQLMRLVVAKGTGKKASAKGYFVGGKTGTAEKQVAGRYDGDARVSSFVGAFPMHDPRYVVFAMLDEPKGNKSTWYYATGGWVAAPVVGRVVKELGPLMGIAPRLEEGEPLPLPLVDDERKKQPAPAPRLIKRASTTAAPPAPKPAVVPLPTPPAAETPSDRIAREARQVLEQAFAGQ